MSTTWFTVSDDRFFPGVVALINSLRVTGNEGAVVVADLGLRPDQRARLQRVATVVDLSDEHLGNPMLYKAFPHALEVRGQVVVIDSDMIVAAPLDDLLVDVAEGRIVLLRDRTQPQRWFREWEELFGLRSPLREGPYQNSGFLAFDAARWPDLLQRWWELCQLIPTSATRAGGGAWEDPLWDADQDALNALLLSEVPAGTVRLYAQDTASVLHEVRVLDRRSLRCARNDSEPVRVLHHTGTPKPWQPGGVLRVRRNAYVRLLPRLLLADDVALQLSPQDLPRWLHQDAAARLRLAVLDVANGAAQAAVRRAPSGVRVRLRGLRLRLVART